jgi:hypothetical protein
MTPMRSSPVDFDLRWARADRAERAGRTKEEARELWRQAAKSATICGGCFRPLGPTDSVTMVGRDVGRWRHEHWIRVPICLLCTLDAIRNNSRGCDVFYETPRWHRDRCLNCGRLIRIHGHSLNARTCCADCQRAVRNKRNNLRRRVKHAQMTCIQCGELFIPKRADAQTCSNKCRQALHRSSSAIGRNGLPLGWRRRPLPDCPMCEGKGTIWINLYGCDGSKKNSEPLGAPCPCVQLDRPRGTDPREFRKRLELTNQEMLATEKRGQRRAQQRQSAVTSSGRRSRVMDNRGRPR